MCAYRSTLTRRGTAHHPTTHFLSSAHLPPDLSLDSSSLVISMFTLHLLQDYKMPMHHKLQSIVVKKNIVEPDWYLLTLWAERVWFPLLENGYDFFMCFIVVLWTALKKKLGGIPSVVQWLALCALTARDPSLVPVWGTNIPQAGQCGQKKKSYNNAWYQVL